MKTGIMDGIKEAAREAGANMLKAQDIENKTSGKEGRANLVTVYDKKNQELLFSRLSALIPDASFVGEEEGEDSFKEEYRKGYVFVIDPIDGTTNFVKGYRPSVVSIGLLHEGIPEAGVIYNPYADLLFSAERGSGAFCNGKQIHTSEEKLSDSLVSFGTTPRYAHLVEQTMELATKYDAKSLGIRISGSAAWDLCQVASGLSGMYYELSLCLWDFTAGSVIVTEAGGRMTDISGKPLTFDGPSSVIAVSSGITDDEILHLSKT